MSGTAVSDASPAWSIRSDGWSGGRGWPVAAACALLAALSLLAAPEITSRDPNNWLVWARQLSLGHELDFTGPVPSWKPLPVLLSAPFARLSPDASNIFWLWLVRFSTLITSALLFALARLRFGWFAGVVAGALPFALPLWFGYALMGDSEPVVSALALGAAISAARGRCRLATGLAVGVALMRPEAWPLLAAWLLWQARTDWRSAAAQAAVAAMVLFAGWMLVPALAGGGLLQASTRAQTRLLVGNQADGLFALLPLRAWALVAAGSWGIWRRRDGLLALLAGGALLWVLEVTVMGWLGYSAIDRYLMPAVIVLCIVAGAGAGTLVDVMPVRWAKLAAGALVAAVTVGLLLSAWSLNRENVTERRAQGESARRGANLFERAGGLGRWRGCLPIATNASYSVILARMIGLPVADFTNRRRAPALVLQQIELVNSINAPVIEGPGSSPVVIARAKPEWVLIHYPGCGR